ncbi:hypothetical protein [Cellulomonas sp.]|uniref:hypothetical protein n=1 Tax=Cellulomonas sp. TaxID=40001 RepID=UPI003BA9FD6D
MSPESTWSEPAVTVTGPVPEMQVPMASIAWAATGSTDGLTIDATDVYLHACERQASIALRSLRRVWALEGDPPDPGVWDAVKDVDGVWADLQSAMTAGIILSRLLKPTGVYAHSGLTQEEARTRADARGAALRAALEVPPDSPVIGIKRVRDSLEHVDERIDAVVGAGNVYSVSDWYLATGGYFGTTPSDVPLPSNARHVNLRTFVPRLGVLVFDRDTVDLFAYEVGLQGLMIAAAKARRQLRVPGRTYSYGQAQIRTWTPEIEGARRVEIAKWRGRYHIDAAREFGESFPNWKPDPEVTPDGLPTSEVEPPATFGPENPVVL